MPEIDPSLIDSRLSEAFKRAATPGDASGVADAIRSRVASGDTGTAPEGPIFPGGGPFGGLLGWMPVVGVVAVAGLVGGVLGATGVFGPGEPASAVGRIAAVDDSVQGLDCPGGTPVAQLAPGERVLATARSEDGGYLGVRNPSDYSGTVWLPVNLVDLDEPNADTLPVGGCPEAVVALGPEPTAEPERAPEPAPAPGPAPGPAPAPPPPSPGDTTKPTIDQWWASKPNIGCPPDTATVYALASDNVAVTNMTIAWTAASGNGSGVMAKSGGQWQYVYTLPAGAPGTPFTITFTLVAFDSAGNQSSSKQVQMQGSCFE